jgi:hypothetical protein
VINHSERIQEQYAPGGAPKQKILTLRARSDLIRQITGGVAASGVDQSLPFTQWNATFSMRLGFKGGIAKLFVLAILLSSLACSELPELCRLSDNTSNDFTPLSYVAGEIASAVSAQLWPASPARALRVTPQQNSTDVPQQVKPFLGSRDLLHLYSISRT